MHVTRRGLRPGEMHKYGMRFIIVVPSGWTRSGLHRTGGFHSSALALERN